MPAWSARRALPARLRPRSCGRIRACRSRRSRRAREAGRRLDDLYPRHRVPLELEPFDAERLAEVADVALVSYPHGAAADGGRRAARRRACAWSTCRPTSGCTTRRCTSAGTGRTARPSCVGEAVFGLTELHRDEIAAAALVANPGCYSTAAILALAPLARAGLIADAVVDAKSGVSGAGPRGDRRARTSCPWTRT